MTTVLIRPDPACDDDSPYGWDDRFPSPAAPYADWSFAGAGEASNVGGLANVAALETAVVLSLHTDCYCPPDHPLAKYADGDRRGWWGEFLLDDGEPIMGSLLWLLTRSVATEEARLYAGHFVQQALAHLVDAGVCARIETDVTFLDRRNGFWIDISFYGRDGVKIYDHRYESAWRQVAPTAIGAPRL